MLSVFTLTDARQAAKYFEKDDYYFSSTQRSPSKWWGRGAEALGLSGVVNQETFARLLAGELPDGTMLPKRQGKVHRPGVDLTFSAPKSVSLLAFVGRDERVFFAHERAVSEALSYLEREAAQARITKDGVTSVVRTSNLVVARFNHDTSRAQDPQLHTHAVVLNATNRGDAWRALSNEALYRNKMVAGAIYRAQLAHELRQIGYSLRRTHADGRFEVDGFTARQLRAFSKRRVEIEAELDREEASGAVAAKRAALTTRKAKHEIDRKALHEAWHEEARALGVVLPKARPVALDPDDPRAPAAAIEFAIAHLTERRAVIPERDLLARAFAQAIGKAAPCEVAAALAARRREGLLQAAEPAHRPPADLGAYLTTPEALATEALLIHLMRSGRDAVEPISSRADLETQLEGTPLNAGQRNAVLLALASSHRFVGVQGYAGTGKTTALNTVRELAEAQDFRVRGFAPSATAAKLLESDAGIASRTVASFLLEAPSLANRSCEKELWVVDELSMVGNQAALELVAAAERTGARVVFVGDRDQLPSIEAGRAFALLSDAGLPSASMDEIVRQKNPALLKAVRATIRHETTEALEAIAEKITVVRGRIDRLSATAKAFLALSPSERKETLVLTASNADRAELNERIRNGLRGEGALRGDELAAPIFVSRGFTQAEARESTAYAIGDVVRFARPYQQLRIAPGAVFTVAAIDSRTNTIMLESQTRRIAWQPHRHTKVEVFEVEHRHLAAGDVIRWTRNDKDLDRRNGERATVLEIDTELHVARVRVGKTEQLLDLKTQPYWEHGYASTVHAAQGRTVDRAILHLDTNQQALIGYESFYVAISRARHEVEIFTDNAECLPDRIAQSLAQESALEAAQNVRGLP
jgi:conjugative relaxase-like TrwC/TraI family protein